MPAINRPRFELNVDFPTGRPIRAQLLTQGVTVPRAELSSSEQHWSAVTTLWLAGVLTDSQFRSARKRIGARLAKVVTVARKGRRQEGM